MKRRKNLKFKKRHKLKFPPIALSGISIAMCITGVFFIRAENVLTNFFKEIAQNQNLYLSILGIEIGALPNEAIEFSLPDFQHDKTISIDDLAENIEDFSYITHQSNFIPQDLSNGISSPISELTLSQSKSDVHVTSSTVYINNQTDKKVNVTDMITSPSFDGFEGEGPHILLIHTHASEAYTPDINNMYVQDDNDRTLDTNFNVIRIGNEIEKVLTNMGIEVIHIEEIFDYPSYNQSYSRTLDAIEAQIAKTPSIQMVIDIHRDAMIASDGTKYKPVSEINEEKVAQLMFVIGSNDGGLTHPNWQDNLNFAVNLQSQINSQYPTLMRSINLRSERFNQHMTPASIILEVGTNGNTLDEALRAGVIFAEQLGQMILNSNE